jgi:three-Cys-motif partner protein
MKPSAYYRGKEQTYLKHFFVERYLEAVAFHIGYSYLAFVYVDCFSGPWRSADEDLADTSIRIALEKLNYVREGLIAQGRTASIRAVFVEKDPTAFRALEAALEQHKHAIITAALPGTFEDNLPAILQHVGERFAFFFIDPKRLGRLRNG